MTFSISYAPAWRWLMSLLGIGPRWSGIEIGGREVIVRMSYAFHARFARDAITSAETIQEGLARRFAGGIGVHGAFGHWRVNGATEPIVRIRLGPRARARVLGIPVRLRTLDVSVDDPDALIAALRG